MPNTDPYGSFTIPEQLHVHEFSFDGHSVTIHASTENPAAKCPSCDHSSRRIHSVYRRTLADLPWCGVPVCLRLRVRKFFCDRPSCSQRIFAERLEAVASAYGLASSK